MAQHVITCNARDFLNAYPGLWKVIGRTVTASHQIQLLFKYSGSCKYCGGLNTIASREIHPRIKAGHTWLDFSCLACTRESLVILTSVLKSVDGEISTARYCIQAAAAPEYFPNTQTLPESDLPLSLFSQQGYIHT